jgi:CBS domain-containing protein
MTISDTPLARVMVDDAMHTGILMTDPETPLKTVARLTAAQASRTEVVTVRADEHLEAAAQLMVDNQTEHLLVVNPDNGHAEGILSTLDVAAAFGGRH